MGGSYGNNTRVICYPAPGRPESAARHSRRRLARALHCGARDSLTPGIVALRIPPSGATTTVLRQKSTQACYNIIQTTLLFLKDVPKPQCNGCHFIVRIPSRQKVIASKLNTLTIEWNSRYFQRHVKCITLNENICIFIQISPRFIHTISIENESTLWGSNRGVIENVSHWWRGNCLWLTVCFKYLNKETRPCPITLPSVMKQLQAFCYMCLKIV